MNDQKYTGFEEYDKQYRSKLTDAKKNKDFYAGYRRRSRLSAPNAGEKTWEYSQNPSETVRIRILYGVFFVLASAAYIFSLSRQSVLNTDFYLSKFTIITFVVLVYLGFLTFHQLTVSKQMTDLKYSLSVRQFKLFLMITALLITIQIPGMLIASSLSGYTLNTPDICSIIGNIFAAVFLILIRVIEGKRRIGMLVSEEETDSEDFNDQNGLLL